MCAEIFGYRDPAVRDYARDLGVALQLTNILRDVGVDYRQRPRVPADRGPGAVRLHRGRHRARGRTGRPRRRNRAHVRVGARASGARGRACSSRAPCERCRRTKRADLVAAEIMRAIYWELLRRIEAARCDVFSAVIRVPRADAGAHRAQDLVDVRAVRATPVRDDRRRCRHRRRLRRPQRGGAACRPPGAGSSWSKRRRGSAAARRRSPIARPASASTTASTCSSAAIARRTRSSTPRHRRHSRRCNRGCASRWPAGDGRRFDAACPRAAAAVAPHGRRAEVARAAACAIV